jgi:transposase InsO family protein
MTWDRLRTAYKQSELVAAALEMAIHRRNPSAGLIHHSDRGAQYTALSFGTKLDVATEEREELSRLRNENRVLRQEREILRKAAAFFARENGIR